MVCTERKEEDTSGPKGQMILMWFRVRAKARTYPSSSLGIEFVPDARSGYIMEHD